MQGQRVAPRLSNYKTTIVRSSQCNLVSIGRLQRLLARRAAVPLAIILNICIFIAACEAPRDEDCRSGELNLVLERLPVLETLLNQVASIGKFLWCLVFLNFTDHWCDWGALVWPVAAHFFLQIALLTLRDVWNWVIVWAFFTSFWPSWIWSACTRKGAFDWHLWVWMLFDSLEMGFMRDWSATTTLHIDFDIEHAFHILAMKAEVAFSFLFHGLVSGLILNTSQLILVLIVLWRRLVLHRGRWVVKFVCRSA